ncbi:recombinase family protein [Rhodococcus sp. NPDC059968]|uniref:recombinase family protein n=1 Tax=Rhodococcus sp. NPDC059968 TaxID=3347017 RepID=UPI003670831D
MSTAGKQTRALIVIRLSRVTDATTSPERQLEACRALCEQRGYEVVGVAEDLDVSAGLTTPFERPQLGDWLDNRFHEVDVLVVYRMDRIVRRLLDLADLIRWGQTHSVSLVSATESFLDLTSPFGDIIALLVAKVAELELEAISSRIASAYHHNRQLGKWTGGAQIPWGYLPRQTDDGWRLYPDPEAVPVINEVAERVLAGETLRAIAHDLNERKIPTAKDRMNQHLGRPLGKPPKSGEERKPFAWTSGGLRRSMASPTMLGYATVREPKRDANGEIQMDARGRKVLEAEDVLRGPDGSPIQRADPILTKRVFDLLATELVSRENRKEPTKRSNALLLRVIFCGVCGRPCYRLKGGQGRRPRYRCSSAQYKATCGNGSVVMEEFDDMIEGQLLALLGRSERRKRVWDKGEDHTEELIEIDHTLTDLVGQLGRGPYRAGTPQRAALDANIEALDKRREELAASTTRPAGWTWQPTGETFRDWWGSLDLEHQNVYLRTMGVKVSFVKPVGGEPDVSVEWGDIEKMAREVTQVGPIATVTETYATMREHGIQGMEIFPDKAVAVMKTGELVEIPHWLDEIGISEITNNDGVRIVWTTDGRGFYHQPSGEWTEIPLT